MVFLLVFYVKVHISLFWVWVSFHHTYHNTFFNCLKDITVRWPLNVRLFFLQIIFKKISECVLIINDRTMLIKRNKLRLLWIEDNHKKPLKPGLKKYTCVWRCLGILQWTLNSGSKGCGFDSRQCLALFLSFSKTLYPHSCSPPICINGYNTW